MVEYYEWLARALQPLEEGAYCCLHVGATLSGPILQCGDCGLVMPSEVDLQRWLKRELVRAEGKMTINRYDKDGELVSCHQLEGVHLKE